MYEINYIISECPETVQSKMLLTRVNQILSEITFVVAFGQTDCSYCERIDDDDCPDFNISLDWDKYTHHNYYNLHSFDNNHDYFSVSSLSMFSDDGGGDYNALEGGVDCDEVEGDDHVEVEGDDHDKVEGEDVEDEPLTIA